MGVRTDLPKVGLRFAHRRIIEADSRAPMLFVVSAVRRGVVYYRPVDGGVSFKADPDYFWSQAVGKIESAEETAPVPSA